MENIIARNVVSSSLSRCLSSTESRKSLRLQELRIFRLSRVYNRMSGLRCIRAWTCSVSGVWYGGGIGRARGVELYGGDGFP